MVAFQISHIDMSHTLLIPPLIGSDILYIHFAAVICCLGVVCSGVQVRYPCSHARATSAHETLMNCECERNMAIKGA